LRVAPDISVGISGPHDFTVHLRLRSSFASKERPPHPALNVRDDREAPLLNERGTVQKMRLILAMREANYFSRQGWTGFLQNCPTGKSVDLF
jgi:hypothetical protein